MITIFIEPSNKANVDKLVGIFKELKKSKPDLSINLKVANRTDALRKYDPQDDEIIIAFGGKLYQHLLKDINEFDKLTGVGGQRDVHKFSYFIRRGDKHYFLACMPPLNFTMTKPETFLAFESFMKSLVANTKGFSIDLRTCYINKSSHDRSKWAVDVIENGFSPRVCTYYKNDEVKNYLYSLFDLPDWHWIAIDTETNGLKIWDNTHDIRIASFSTSENFGHAINLNLPGIMGCYIDGQREEIYALFEKYIFEKPKTFIAWNCGFDIFAICNRFGRSFKEFARNNKIIDGMQLLHVMSENRKIEGYNLKAVSRDLLNYAQYAYVEKYIHYIENWKTYSVDKVLDAAASSLKYAAEDAAAEYTLTYNINAELDTDPICKVFKDIVAPKIMAVKLETEWNGLSVDAKSMAENSMLFSGWELDNIVKPTLTKVSESVDKKCHAEMFVFSTVTGRMLYSKPYLNAMKIGTKAAEFFVADPGHTLVYIDLNSADVRTAALVAQDYRMIDDLNGEEDFYLKFAKILFNGNTGEKERNVAKAFVLSMLNLAGEDTIAKETGVSIGDVKEYKKRFYATYPRMQQYRFELERFFMQNKYVFSPSWRKRRFSEDDMQKGEKGYGGNYWKSFLSAHNFPFQSTTADIMVLNCFKFIGETRGYGIKQSLLNIDAAVFNVPDEHLDSALTHFITFRDIPHVIWDGVLKFQELVFNAPKPTKLDIKVPRMTYKLFKGKNLKDMEAWG